jgi:hypothetical protein
MELEFELELERRAAPVTLTPSRSEICLNAHRSSFAGSSGTLCTHSRYEERPPGDNRVISVISRGKLLIDAPGRAGKSVTCLKSNRGGTNSSKGGGRRPYRCSHAWNEGGINPSSQKRFRQSPAGAVAASARIVFELPEI